MPPHRTFPPAKPIKTERTHEENQERAYIAASRRSDRSLEARVESARRASEIHKRRTGRALRVTEEDVINEEMYEEEDDDLPSQYRRLTAHLQTGSADFNRRLTAYLTNQLAMRSALDQAVHHSYAQQFPNAPQYAHNQTMFPSPLQAGVAGNLFGLPSPTMPAPHPYRQSPYPTPARPTHERKTSAEDLPISTGIEPSTITGSDTTFLSTGSMATPPTNTRQVSNNLPDTTTKSMSSAQGLTASSLPNTTDSQTRSMGTIAEHVDFGPLSMALPQESQLLLGSILDLNDPFAQQLMGGYPLTYDQPTPKPQAYRPGINMTLAPSAMSLTPQQSFAATSLSNEPYDLAFDADLLGYKGVSFGSMAPLSTPELGVDTSAETEWDSFINESSWADGT